MGALAAAGTGAGGGRISDVSTWADDVAELAEIAGVTLTAGERSFLACMDGEPVVVARSETAMRAAILGWLFLDAAQVIYAASGSARLGAFRPLVDAVRGVPELSSRVRRISCTNGGEEIEVQDGGRIRFISGSAHAGRGCTADKLVIGPGVGSGVRERLAPVIAGRPGAQLICYGDEV